MKVTGLAFWFVAVCLGGAIVTEALFNFVMPVFNGVASLLNNPLGGLLR